jgi:hypothetical protein
MKHQYILQRSTLSKISRTIITLGFVLVILVSSAYGQQIIISSGAYFNNSGSAYIVINNGDFINNGTYTNDTETVILSGNNAKEISGSSNTEIHNLLVTNTGGITTLLDRLTVYDLAINTGSKFTINPTKNLLVGGTLTNSASTGGFILKSDATGTAALIHSTDNVPATVQRYISGDSEDWHFLSSPVSNQPISGSWLPSGSYGNGTGYDLYIWDEPTNCWVYNLNTTGTPNWPTIHPSDNFVAGRGYLYSVQEANPTKEFAGNLNNGSLSYGLTSGSSDITLKGFNLVGNPYPSSIDWQASSGWSRSNLVESGGGYDMWIWNPAASNYGVSNSFTGLSTNGVTQHIAPMQGFFVQAASDGHLLMDNNLRVFEGASSWLKNQQYDDSNISVSVVSESGNGSDEAIIGFGYINNENGATKLFSRVPTAPSLYLALESENLSVRYLTNTEVNPAIPLSFNPGANGNFTLSCNFDPLNFETVMLEDRKTSYIQNMKAISTYSFYSSKADVANRFVLYFGPVGINPENIFPAKVYTDGYYLIIDLTLISGDTETYVYDIMGCLLLQRKLQGETQHKLNLSVGSQIILVSLKNPAGGLNQKVFWNGNR